MARPERALLLTGVYGSGKSTVAADIADLLDERGDTYAAIDLDWLAWANVPAADHDDPQLLFQNLAAVVANDRAAGVGTFVLAGSVGSREMLVGLRDAVGCAVAVVRLDVPAAVVEARLRADPTRARADDLAVALEWIATGRGVGLEDALVDGTGDVRTIAVRVLEAVGWK